MSTKKKSSKRRPKKDQSHDEASSSLLEESSQSSSDAPAAPQSTSDDTQQQHHANNPLLMAPIPMPHTRSLHSIHDTNIHINNSIGGGCVQFGPSLHQSDNDATIIVDGSSNNIPPAESYPLQRTLSSPTPYRPLLHRANSAFGNFRLVRNNNTNNNNKLLIHQHSDPGTARIMSSAFHPVISKCSVETESITSEVISFEMENSNESVGITTTLDTGRDLQHPSETIGSKKISPPRLGSKLLSGIKGALNKSRRKIVLSGRENPVSLLAEEEEDEEEDGGVGVVAADVVENREGEYTTSAADALSQRLESSYRNNSDIYSDNDLDEDAMEPIVGQYHLLDEENSTGTYGDDNDRADNSNRNGNPRPPSVELGSVEVVATEGTGSSLTGLHYVLDNAEGNSTELRPPSVEVMHPITDDIPELESSPAYHPLVDDDGDDDPENQDNDTLEAISFPIQLTYKSSKANITSSPDHSNKSSGSPHSRTTTSGNSQADYEVRETNRRSCQISRNCEEVVVDLDGNATVHSSSTSSSNYYHVHSPKIREGAMPGERFFSSTPTTVDEEGLNICSFSLSPNKSGNRDIMEQLMQRFPPSSGSHSSHPRTHSPHTVSSASISNTSSSGSETKKPLKFVAIKKGAEQSLGAIIKPRISKGERPPMQTFTSYQKPPQSPRKDLIRGSGARTPTRTPPPRGECGNGSGANTPSSPPVIMDVPVRRDLKIPTKPHGVRTGSGRGMILRPPSSELLYQQLDLQTVTSELTESVAVTVDKGTNDGAQEVTTSFNQTMVVTPEKETRRLHQKWNEPQHQHDMDRRKNAQDCKKRNAATIISPEKQG